MLVKTKPTKQKPPDPTPVETNNKTLIIAGCALVVYIFGKYQFALEFISMRNFVVYFVSRRPRVLLLNPYVRLCWVLYSSYWFEIKTFQRFTHSAIAVFFSSVDMALNLKTLRDFI